jgi:hypothetical protein
MTTRELCPKPGIQRWPSKLLLCAILIAAYGLCALWLTGCSDTTGPSEPSDSLRPQFQKVYQGGEGGGHGGGGGGGYPACSSLVVSRECWYKGWLLIGGAAALAAQCPDVIGCILGGYAWHEAANRWEAIPDCRNCDGGSFPTLGPTDPWLMPGNPYSPGH